MLILHDSPSVDLSHIQAIGDITEGFALFDYVKIENWAVSSGTGSGRSTTARRRSTSTRAS